jgi:hypothetical protein
VRVLLLRIVLMRRSAPNSGGATRTIDAGSVIAIREFTGVGTPAAADALIGWRATTP